MTTTPLDVAVDPVHAARLAELTYKTDRVRYACQNGPGPSTDEVLQWLAAYGYDMKRPYVSTLVTNYRATLGLDQTGELPAMTDEVLADLDRRASEPTADVVTPDEQGVQTPEAPVVTPDESVSTHDRKSASPQMRTEPVVLVELAPAPAAVETPKPAAAPRGAVARTGMAVLLTLVALLLAGVIVAPIALSSQDIIDWAGSPTGLGLHGPWDVVTFLALDAAAAVCVGLVVYCAWRNDSPGVFGWLVWAFAGTSAYANYRHGTAPGAAPDAVWFFPAMSVAGPFLLEVTVRRVRKWIKEGTGQRAKHGVSFGVARWIPGVGALRETYGAWRLARLDSIDDADKAVRAYRKLCPDGSIRVVRALRKRDAA